MRQAVLLLDHSIRSNQPSFGHAFQPLLAPLDEHALGILDKHIRPHVPHKSSERYEFFNPDLGQLSSHERNLSERNGRYLRSNLEYGRSIQRLGTLLFCLNYAQSDGAGAHGVWNIVEQQFSNQVFAELYRCLDQVNEFRNTRVAHVEQPLTDQVEAWRMMELWLKCLDKMSSILAN